MKTKVFLSILSFLFAFSSPKQKEKNYKEEKADDGNRRLGTCAIAVFYTFFENVYFLFQFFLFIQFQPYKFAPENK